MFTRSTSIRKFTRVAAVMSGAALTATLIAAPAQAADTGLYGRTDPVADGVYRQSLALLGLTAVGVDPAQSAITWLLEQQCADGSFQSYRPDTSVPCAPSDPEAFTGPDTNSTAVAAMALAAVGEKQAATRAAAALVRGAQGTRRSAAWPYNFGGKPDSSSTGLVVNALEVAAEDSPFVEAGQRWLRARIIPCGRKYGGAIRNDTESAAANNFATAQGLIGLTEALLVEAESSDPGPNPPCAGSAITRTASYLARTLTEDGILTYSGFGGNDYGSTAASVIALEDAELGSQAIDRAVAALKKDARAWITTDTGDSVGAAGWLLMVAQATDQNPRSFGGVNLVQTITGSIR